MLNISRIQEQEEVLRDFYLDVESNFKLVQIDDSRFKAKWSEEEKGQWALEQIETVAATLLVTRFIMKGGDTVPVLEDLSVYVDKALSFKADKLTQLNSMLPFMKSRYELLSNKLEEFGREKFAREQELEAMDSGMKGSPNTPQVAPSITAKLKKELKIKELEKELTQDAENDTRRRYYAR